MSEPVNNNQNSKEDEPQGSSNRINKNSQQDPSGDPTLALEVSSTVEDPNYWKNLVIELMKRIPPASPTTPVPPENSSKSDKLADRVAQCNPKVYDGNLDPVELEDWIREMEKIFAIVKVPKEKKVNIETFYLAGEADIWCSTVKDK